MATTQAPSKMTGRKKLALWLLIAPTGLIVAAIILFAFTNATLTFGYSSGMADIRVLINIVLYLFGLVGFLAWLPGLVTGIVLLATPPAKK